MNRIDELFQRKRAQGGKILIIFLTAGYPDVATSVDLAVGAAEAGADLIELGIPFSDPIADGPSIQRSSKIALDRGMTLRKTIEATAAIRKRSDVPLILFGAFNPILKYEPEAFVRDAKAAGADGFIIPELPPEESEEFEAICRKNEMTMTHLIAPTSPPERKAEIAARSTGFVYYISRMGVTGAKASLADDLRDQVAEVRKATDKPIAVGFGISKPDQAAQVAESCDAIVVGSAYIDLIAENEGQPDLLDKASEYVASLAGAIR